MPRVDLHNMNEDELREEVERLRASRRKSSAGRKRVVREKKEKKSRGVPKSREEKWKEKGIKVEEI